jgi:glycosyltransferase involved in cell wall biosynthesis
MRETLSNTIKSVKAVIPNPTLILITGKGAIGDLRNQGLIKCTSDFMCFVDDDIILNPEWYAKCMQTLKANPDAIAVCGHTPFHHTLGCMICRTKELIKCGGFPPLDDHILEKLDPKILTVTDAVCEHQVKRGFGPLKHNLHFFFHGFQTEERAGWVLNPRRQVWISLCYFKAGHPDYAVGSLVWIVKPFFVFPFIIEDKIDRKKRKVETLPMLTTD